MSWPPTLPTNEAAAILGTTADTLYTLVRQGKAPIEPLRLGTKLRWPTRPLLRLVGLEDEIDVPGSGS